jgi:hypothetical protein
MMPPMHAAPGLVGVEADTTTRDECLRRRCFFQENEGERGASPFLLALDIKILRPAKQRKLVTLARRRRKKIAA